VHLNETELEHKCIQDSSQSTKSLSCEKSATAESGSKAERLDDKIMSAKGITESTVKERRQFSVPSKTSSTFVDDESKDKSGIVAGHNSSKVLSRACSVDSSKEETKTTTRKHRAARKSASAVYDQTTVSGKEGAEKNTNPREIIQEERGNASYCVYCFERALKLFL